MSKSKKLFSIALAVLLALQLLLIPTFAEGETATGKYTTADNLPLIYGAGVSVEDFEDTSLPTDTTVNKAVDKGGSSYGNLSVSNSCSSTFQRNTAKDAGQLSNGNSSLKVNVSNQANFKFFINLSSYKTNLSQNGNIAFYVNLPAGTVNLPSNASDNAKAAMTDGKYGIKLGLAANNDQDTVATTVLANTSFTYYFEDGTTYTAQNESGIYPYKNKNGEISTEGFKGYVSVSIANADLSTTPYLIFTSLYTSWAGFLQSKTVYFDDFRLLNSEYFVPYALMDYENVVSTWDPTSWYTNDSLTYARKDSNANPNFDTTGAAQGSNSLKITTCTNRGAFNARIMLTKSGATTPIFGDEYNGIAFYIDIPELTSGKDINQFKAVNVGLCSGGDKPIAQSLSAVITYWFEDGSILVKYGDDGIYPYDKYGNLTTEGFTGYISVSFHKADLITNRFLGIMGQDYNEPLYSGQVIYIDDIRPCNFNVVEDIVSGDAYYINDTAVPVQKVGDTATLSVMTNLATLGMARNAEGLEALRKVLLEEVTEANKHKVNSDENVDIRDLVALYNLAV